MPETSEKSPRTRDANRARQVILESAEAVFAEHGFAGARMDAIARASGYNISLLFQYFTDKLGLYAAVLQRAGQETSELQARVLGPLLADEAAAANPQAFRAGLETAVGATFDYLAEHPRLVRIMTWEMAAGWGTLAQILAQYPSDGYQPLEALFSRAWQAGLLRSRAAGTIQLTLVFQVCQSYLAFAPLYQLISPAGAAPGAAGPVETGPVPAREHVIAFVVGGILFDEPHRR